MAKQAAATSTFASTTPLIVDSQKTDGNTATRVTSHLESAVPTLAAGESITAAILSVLVTNTSSNGPQVFRTATSWRESGVT